MLTQEQTFTLPRIMGILNVTPDSFSDGGRYDALETAVKRGLNLVGQGADILDIGGESTRPGAAEVNIEEEIRRTVPVIAALREQSRDLETGITISIDTRKPEVAEAAVHAGADIWNDVTALTFSEKSVDVAADLGCPVILMHIKGSPETMQDNPHYEDAVEEVINWLARRAETAMAAGIEDIILDPGIGFGKRLEDNLALIRELPRLKALGFPVLMGASRKSFISKIDGSSVDDRLGGSLASALWSAAHGADILRVHDVPETVQAMKVWGSISNE